MKTLEGGLNYYLGANYGIIHPIYHGPLGMSPFQALYGREPSGISHYEPGSSSVEVVDDMITLREESLARIKNNLTKAQMQTKLHADKGRLDREF